MDFTDSTAGAFLFETYEELRANGSVQFLARHGSWIVLGYDEVEHVLAHPESYSSDLPQMREMDPVLFAADPPSHTAMRRTLGRQFTPQHISSHARAAEELAGGLLASLAAVEEFDVVADFAEPLAEHAGARILGIDAGRVASLREAFTASRGDNLQLYRLLATPFQPLAPETTLFGELVEAGLDEAAARSLVRAMWAASTGELRRVIPQVVLAMLENAEARRRVTEDASLLGAFLDETLRLRPPEHVILRRTTHELELGGARIPANATLRLSIAAANRDPRHFADPSAFRLDRSGSGHLAFGGGAHRCLGAALARAVTIATVGSLLRAAPRFKARQPLSTIRHAPGAPLASVEQLVIVHE